MTQEGIHGVSTFGNYAYVADDYNGLVVVNVSKPATQLESEAFTQNGRSRGVYVQGNYAYVADDYNGLVIIDGVIQQIQPSRVL